MELGDRLRLRGSRRQQYDCCGEDRSLHCLPLLEQARQPPRRAPDCGWIGSGATIPAIGRRRNLAPNGAAVILLVAVSRLGLPTAFAEAYAHAASAAYPPACAASTSGRCAASAAAPACASAPGPCSAAAGAPGRCAASAAAPACAPDRCSAAAASAAAPAAALGKSYALAELGFVFLVEDIKRRQADVGDFLFSKSNDGA